MALLEARGISKHFGGLAAVSGLDLDIEKGKEHWAFRPVVAPKVPTPRATTQPKLMTLAMANSVNEA